MAVHSALITVMINAARKAARSLVRDFGEIENIQISRKGVADFVSAADLRAEEIIIEVLQEARPKYGFLLEERGIIEGSDNSNRWIIDPLDGTTNFLHGFGQFAVSIGLERDRKPFAGIIFNPITDELFWAEKGQGAWMNDQRLRVTQRRDLFECLFACGLPFAGRDGRAKALHETDLVLSRSSGIRRMGSAALDLAYVAAGRFDGYWERDLNPWDIAAGIILVQEAGGMVTQIDGSKDPLHGPSILAANAEIYDRFKNLLAGKRD